MTKKYPAKAVWPPKRVDEDILLSWDFSAALATGETISTGTVTATTIEGTDPSPNDIVSGSTTTSGAVVSQKIINGVDGATYLLECEITTDQGQKLHGLAYLDVTESTKRVGS